MKKNEDRDISFLGKIILFFKRLIEYVAGLRIPQRIIAHEKKIAGYNGPDSPREAKLSFVFGMSRLFAIVFLCIILTAVLVFGGSAIAYDNVYYMFRDIGFMSSFNESRPDSLNYSRPFENQDFTTFKNGLAVAGDSEIKLFASTGSATLTDGLGYTNPKITSSDSTVLVYDQGRKSFSVYNSFVRLYTETLDYPISYADMAPDGSFCVVTRSSEYGSVVRVYDEKFRLESEVFKNDYVISVSMSDSGRNIAVLSLGAKEGESVTTLTVIERGKQKPRSSVSINDVMPYTASFISDGSIAVICAEGAYVYNLDGKVQNNCEYPSKLANVSVSENGFALLFKNNDLNSGYVLHLYGEFGNLLRRVDLSGHVSAVELGEKYVYVLFDTEIKRIDITLGLSSTVKFKDEVSELVAFSDGSLMACTDTVAYYISFS